MTTITAQRGQTTRSPRGSVAFISVLAVGVIGVGAAVTLPRLLSSEPATTQPAVVAPAAISHTNEHSGFPAGTDEWPRTNSQPRPGAKHPLGRALHQSATATYGQTHRHGAVL